MNFFRFACRQIELVFANVSGGGWHKDCTELGLWAVLFVSRIDIIGRIHGMIVEWKEYECSTGNNDNYAKWVWESAENYEWGCL